MRFITFFVLSIFIIGCGSTTLPDYETFKNKDFAGTQYIARNIQVTYDDYRHPYRFNLLKTNEIVGVEDYYVSFSSLSRGQYTANSMVDSLQFNVDGKLITLVPAEFYHQSTYSTKTQVLGEKTTYYYPIDEDQILEISHGTNVFVLAFIGDKTDKGILPIESIERFKVFLEKYADK